MLVAGDCALQQPHASILADGAVTAAGRRACQSFSAGCWVGSSLKRRLHATALTLTMQPGTVRMRSGVLACQSFSAGCWVGSSLKRRLHSTRSRENLSSGEKRAGWAEKVGEPSGAAFCSSSSSSTQRLPTVPRFQVRLLSELSGAVFRSSSSQSLLSSTALPHHLASGARGRWRCLGELWCLQTLRESAAATQLTCRV